MRCERGVKLEQEADESSVPKADLAQLWPHLALLGCSAGAALWRQAVRTCRDLCARAHLVFELAAGACSWAPAWSGLSGSSVQSPGLRSVPAALPEPRVAVLGVCL